jgi:hypothetical protein
MGDDGELENDKTITIRSCHFGVESAHEITGCGCGDRRFGCRNGMRPEWCARRIFRACVAGPARWSHESCRAGKVGSPNAARGDERAGCRKVCGTHAAWRNERSGSGEIRSTTPLSGGARTVFGRSRTLLGHAGTLCRKSRTQHDLCATHRVQPVKPDPGGPAFGARRAADAVWPFAGQRPLQLGRQGSQLARQGSRWR